MSEIDTKGCNSKIAKNKDLIKKYKNFQKYLKATKYYLKDNPNDLDSTVLALLYEKVLGKTKDYLPTNCKINEPFYSKGGKDTYTVSQLYIDKRTDYKKLYIKTLVKPIKNNVEYLPEYSDSIHKCLVKCLRNNSIKSLKRLIKKDNFKHSAFDRTSSFSMWLAVCMAMGLFVSAFNYCSEYTSVTTGLIKTICILSLVFGLSIFSYNYFDHTALKYRDRHLIYDTNLTCNAVSPDKFGSIISKLNHNLNDDVDDLEAKNMSIELSHHNKLEPTIHMRKIEKQGTTWDKLAKQVVNQD